jgi:hypothetical protein
MIAPPNSASLELGARLLDEFDALSGLSPLVTLAWLVLVLVLAWSLASGGPRIVRMIWRLGLDPRRRLGLLASALRVTGLLVGTIGVLRPVISRAPTLGSIAALAAVALVGVIAPTHLRNLASGLALISRSRLREGDLVAVAGIEGRVRDIGLLRVSLRTADGGVTHVPAADFDRAAVTVGSRQAAVPIEARMITGPEFDDAALERLRRAVWLSPYRRAGTDPRVVFDVERGRTVEVRIDTWATISTAEVERHLRALLIGYVGGRPSELPNDDDVAEPEEVEA